MVATTISRTLVVKSLAIQGPDFYADERKMPSSESHRLSLSNLSDQPMKLRGLQAGLIRLGRKEGGGGKGRGRPLARSPGLSRARRG